MEIKWESWSNSKPHILHTILYILSLKEQGGHCDTLPRCPLYGWRPYSLDARNALRVKPQLLVPYILLGLKKLLGSRSCFISGTNQCMIRSLGLFALIQQCQNSMWGQLRVPTRLHYSPTSHSAQFCSFMGVDARASLINFLHANLLLKVCFLRKPTCDSELENGDGNNTSAKFSTRKVGCGRNTRITLDLEFWISVQMVSYGLEAVSEFGVTESPAPEHSLSVSLIGRKWKQGIQSW